MTTTAEPHALRLRPSTDLSFVDYMPDADFTIAFDRSTKGPAFASTTLVIETKLDLGPDPKFADAVKNALSDLSVEGRAKLYLLLAQNVQAILTQSGVGITILEAACGLIPPDPDPIGKARSKISKP